MWAIALVGSWSPCQKYSQDDADDALKFLDIPFCSMVDTQGKGGYPGEPSRSAGPLVHLDCYAQPPIIAIPSKQGMAIAQPVDSMRRWGGDFGERASLARIA
jgi:hypothetical protein